MTSASPPRKLPRTRGGVLGSARSAFTPVHVSDHDDEDDEEDLSESDENDEILIVVRVGTQTVHVMEADARALQRHCALLRTALQSEPVLASERTTTYNNETVQRVRVDNPIIDSADVVSVVRLCEVLAGVRSADELEHLHVTHATVAAAYAMGANGAAVLASALLHGAPSSAYSFQPQYYA